MQSGLTEEQVGKSLRNSVLDGTAYSVMSGLTVNYITPYALTMKATTAQIGLLSSIPNFTMSLVQLAAPTLSERVGSRKGFILPVVFMNALMWLPILLIPYIFHSNQVWWLILFQTLVTAFDSMSNPPWGSMMADLVQREIRGRFFGNRNRIMGMVSMIFSFLAGIILQLLTGNTNLAFSIIFAGAMISRLASFYFLSKMNEPLSYTNGKKHESILTISRSLLSTNIGRFIIYCSLINLTTLIAGPFFTPFMLRELKFSYITYTIINGVAALTTIGFMPWWGRRTDRAGSIKILKLTSFLVPLVPMMWLVSTNLYWIIFAQILSGFAWSGWQLSSSIFIYDASPQENRTRFIAIYNALTFLGVSVGSLIGGYVAPYLPLIKGSYFLSIFLLSGLMRLLVALLFHSRISEVREVPIVTTKELLFKGSPFIQLKNFAGNLLKYINKKP